MKIDVEFRTGWHWFLHDGKLYYSFDKVQLEDFAAVYINKTIPREKFNQWYFSETFDEKLIKGIEPSEDSASGLIAFQVDGLGIMIMNNNLRINVGE